jgi:hypothetical protein
MWTMWRHWRWPWRRPPVHPTPPRRSNPDRIAVLEHELLDITPEPGTRAAHAVALAKPVDQDACPHDDVIDVSEMGTTRRMGLCGPCGASMVATDEGDGERP